MTSEIIGDLHERQTIPVLGDVLSSFMVGEVSVWTHLFVTVEMKLIVGQIMERLHTF